MTLLMAAPAGGGVAAVSDRKERRRGLPGRQATRFYMDASRGFCASFAGDGRAAGGLIKGLEEGGADAGVDGALRDLAASLHEELGPGARVDGIVTTAGPRGCTVRDLYTSGGHVDLRPIYGAMTVHGDRAAVAVCRYLAGHFDTVPMPPDTAAALLHVFAAGAAETVASVGERKKYGIDAAVFTASKGAYVLEKCDEELGTLEIRFRTAGRMGLSTDVHDGGRQHG